MVETSGSKRPPDTPFYQQRLKAWQPILTPKWVVITFLLVGIVFIPVGLLLKAASDSVVEASVQYGGEGQTGSNCTTTGTGHTCVVSITAPEDMEAPIFVYYQLDNFYQNHRRYVKSRDDKQLLGEILPESDLGDCDPKVTNGTGSVLHPCGLIANSYFNDVFELQSPLVLDETDISWTSDREDKFKAVSAADRAANPDIQFIQETYPNSIDASKGVTDEHFIVWMRTAALPSFRKLYGRIRTKVNKGDKMTFVVTNQFEVNSFDGKKYLVVSTTSWLGGKNSFLGWAYIGVGIGCLVLALIFAIKHKKDGRALGDPQYMSWNP